MSGTALASGPANWLATEIAPGSWTYRLGASDLDRLDAALRRARAAGHDRAHPEIARFSPPLDCLAPVAQALRSGVGFALLRGLPVERYGIEELEILLCLFGAGLGRIVPQSSAGEFLHHVRPCASVSDRGYRTRAVLPFHSDSCDISALLCRRPAAIGGESIIASTAAIHDALLARRPELLAALYEPLHLDRLGEGPRGASQTYATPLFMRHAGALFSRFNPGCVESAQAYPETPRLTPLQHEAIALFELLAGADPFRLTMRLAPGDIQLLDNHSIVHARTAFEGERHLLRLWLFTTAYENLPMPMRERYRDMERWQAREARPCA